MILDNKFIVDEKNGVLEKKENPQQTVNQQLLFAITVSVHACLKVYGDWYSSSVSLCPGIAFGRKCVSPSQWSAHRRLGPNCDVSSSSMAVIRAHIVYILHDERVRSVIKVGEMCRARSQSQPTKSNTTFTYLPNASTQ
jgi:hypothetical protein